MAECANFFIRRTIAHASIVRERRFLSPNMQYEIYPLTAQDVKMGVAIVVALVGVVCPDIPF